MKALFSGADTRSKTPTVTKRCDWRFGLTAIATVLAMGVPAAAFAAEASDSAAAPARPDASANSEVVVNGIPYRETVLPARLSVDSTYGLKLNVLDTPRTVTFSVYNLTDRRNWSSAPSLYGNDMLVLNNPRTLELRLQAKF